MKRALFILGLMLIFSSSQAQELKSFKKGKLIGFKDSFGTIVTQPKYMKVGEFEKGYTWVMLGNKFGVIDATGTEVVPLEYDYVDLFNDGMVAVNQGGTLTGDGFFDGGGWTFIDLSTGAPISDFVYTQVGPFIDGLAWVQMGGNLQRKVRTYAQYDKNTGSAAGSRMFTISDFFSMDDLFNKYRSTGNWSLINKNGETVTDKKYTLVGNFQNGLCWVMRDDKYGYIDENGAEVIPAHYKLVQGCPDAPVSVYKYTVQGASTRWVSDFSGKKAWYDAKGNMVVPFEMRDEIFSITQTIPNEIWDY